MTAVISVSAGLTLYFCSDSSIEKVRNSAHNAAGSLAVDCEHKR